MGLRKGIVLVLGTLIVVGAVVGSAAGWFGEVVVCGADRAPGCAAWPMAISALVWAAFVAGVAALLIWQLRS